MKKVIDTIKEIINKDVSTQTEPVTIIENEGDMPQLGGTEDQQIFKSELKQQRDEYAVEIRKTKRGDILEEKREKLLSGQDHVGEQEKMKEELGKQQIKPDASFYDKCKAYLNSIDPESFNYCSLKQATEFDIDDKIDLNKSIKSAFSAHMGDSKDRQEETDVLKQATAALYMIYQEKEINLGIGNNLRHAIYADLQEVVGIEISGEIMSFLDNYGV